MTIVLIVLAIAAIVTIYLTTINGGAKQIDYDTFVQYVENHSYKQGEGDAVLDSQGNVVEGYRYSEGKLQVQTEVDGKTQ